MRGKLAPGHKVYLMFRVCMLFNIAQLAGGILSFSGGAGHLSVLMVIFLLFFIFRTALLLFEARFFFNFSRQSLFFFFLQ